MNSPSLRRKVVLFLLLTTLVAAPWAAAGPRWESPPTGKLAFSQVLELLSRAWTRLMDVRTKEGCGIDPNGEEGCGIDPDGFSPVQADSGCGIDPDGCSKVETDTGCGIDPSGRCGS